MRYLRIRQGVSLFKSKVVYGGFCRCIIAVPATYVVTNIPTASSRKRASSEDFKSGKILVPFYIAALSAVATFAREGS